MEAKSLNDDMNTNGNQQISQINQEQSSVDRDIKRLEDVNVEVLKKVCNKLFAFGVPAHVSGYKYLISAIMLTIDDPTCLREVTGRLYPTIAAEFNTLPARVERAIRNAIEISFVRGNRVALHDFFGSAVNVHKGKITNSEFIAITAQKISLEMLDTANR